ncbi:MAG: hypothetical protein FRX48_01714 [Lasallia pustulata]|uniref:Uncharacterized protein n=1 Tax=Lasallia pustulata TaxID=136370 RepID=A0A5M8PYZ7_9LECA|nr:MAG: hypothetical protein FRX48_01714 [Lasallia pustulata]
MISPVTTDVLFTNSKMNADDGVVPRKARVESIYHVDNSDHENSISSIDGEVFFTVSLGDPECREDKDEQGLMGTWETVVADSRPADLCLGEKYARLIVGWRVPYRRVQYPQSIGITSPLHAKRCSFFEVLYIAYVT